MHSAKITIKYPLSLVPFARQLLWWSLPVFFFGSAILPDEWLWISLCFHMVPILNLFVLLLDFRVARCQICRPMKNIYIFIHIPYTINLSIERGDDDLPTQNWNMIINFLFFEYAQSLRVNAFFAEQILYTHSLWWIANWIRHWKAWSALHILLYEWNSSYNDTCFFVCAFSWHLKCVYVIMWLRNETCRRLLLFAQFWVARNKKQNNKTKFYPLRCI